MPVNFGRDIAPRQIQALANYDYVDISEGTGIVVFHGGAQRSSSGGFTYVLSRNAFYSDQIASGGNNTGTDDLKVFDQNFDVTFIKPQIINGKSLIVCPMEVKANTTAAGKNYGTYVTCAIQKVSEGTSTELFALTSGSLITTAGSVDHAYSTIQANIPLTHFKANDTLRLQVQLFSRGNAADITYSLLGFDPKNRIQSGSLDAGSADHNWVKGDADLQFHVPFRLNT